MNTTGLSRPTVETVAEGLLDQGWVTVTDPDDLAAGRGRGRPARLYRFNASAAHVIGVDIGAHTVAASLADLRGNPVATIRERVFPTMGAVERLAITTRAIETLGSQASIELSEILAVTVGTPGTVSPSKERVGKSPGMPGWPDVDVVATLRQAVGCEVELENDANLAAVGERALGVARNCDDLLFLLLGERLGAGVISNGELVRGRNGAAGEIGYVHAKGSKNRDPAFGSLESMVNASALLELGRKAMRDDPASRLVDLAGGDPASLTAEAITQAATEGDQAASSALRSLARVLAAGVAPALLTLNPEIMVIGGGISRGGSVLRDELARALDDLLLYPPEIRISALGDEAVLVGAVDQSIQRVELEVLSKVSA
jgi:predicted NBD/HSP70 family sugar kinase